jgi:dipeptidyl aminopeptidase/acylaminoacyl peptidase
MNVPTGEGPFPVVLVLHGYVRHQYRRTLTYTTRYADALAGAGYLVIHPNFRNHPPSDSDDEPDLFRIGYAIDVLNLIGLVRKQGEEPGPLERAEADSLGLWGHSMGGGIALRVITVDPDVRAAVVYGSMSADERLNQERIRLWSGGERGDVELAVPEETLALIEPINFLDRVQAGVSIHHGMLDDTVPPQWSSDLHERLVELDKDVEYFEYPDQPHIFADDGDRLFVERTIAFFDARLKTPDVAVQ